MYGGASLCIHFFLNETQLNMTGQFGIEMRLLSTGRSVSQKWLSLLWTFSLEEDVEDLVGRKIRDKT